MAISYPLTFPTTRGTRDVTLTMVDTVAEYSATFTAQQQVHAYKGQWWEATVTLPPMKRDNAEAFASFLAKLRGKRGTFRMGISSAGTARGSPAGSPVFQSVSSDGYTLTTNGWSNSVTDLLKEGDYIQIEDYLYKVVEDTDSDGSGNADIEVWPAIRQDAVSGTSTIDFTDPKSIWMLKDNVREFSIDVAKLYRLPPFTCKEALRF